MMFCPTFRWLECWLLSIFLSEQGNLNIVEFVMYVADFSDATCCGTQLCLFLVSFSFRFKSVAYVCVKECIPTLHSFSGEYWCVCGTAFWFQNILGIYESINPLSLGAWHQAGADSILAAKSLQGSCSQTSLGL